MRTVYSVSEQHLVGEEYNSFKTGRLVGYAVLALLSIYGNSVSVFTWLSSRKYTGILSIFFSGKVTLKKLNNFNSFGLMSTLVEIKFRPSAMLTTFHVLWCIDFSHPKFSLLVYEYLDLVI
jgi:hypothetical protein